MQQALEALEQYKGVVVTHYDPESFRRMEVDGGQAARDAIAALKQALAEPEQEPLRLQCTTCGTVYADGVPPQVHEQEPVAWMESPTGGKHEHQ